MTEGSVRSPGRSAGAGSAFRNVPGFREGTQGARDFVREVYDQAASDNIFFLASGLTFSALLAAIPFLFLLLAVAGAALGHRIDAPQSAVMNWLVSVLPVSAEMASELRVRLADVVEASRSAGLISGILFVWFSTRLFGALRTALDSVFDFREGPGIIWGKVLDVRMVVIATLLLTANIGITTTLMAVSREMLAELHIPAGLPLRVLGYLTAWGAIFLMFTLIYKFLPSTRLGWRIAAVAGLVSAVGFELVKGAIGWYLAEVADFSRVFFAFATLGILVLAAYYAAVVFVLGGEVAKVYGLRRVMRRQRELFEAG